MEKVDIVIGVVGVLALVATGLGVALYDDAATSYIAQETDMDLGSQGPEAADASGTFFEFDTPDNAFGATFEVTVTASGIANPQASVSVTLVIVGPENSTTETIETFAFGDGSATFTLTSEAAWMDMPEPFRGQDADVEAHTMTWSQPIELQVYVDGPGASPIPIGGNDSYTAEVTGTAHTYEIVPELPEVEAQ